MVVVDGQVVRLQLAYRVIVSVNRQAGTAHDFLCSRDLRRGQDIIGHGDIQIEAVGIAGDVGKLPALRFHIESAFSVREPLARDMNYAFDVFEIPWQCMRLAEIDRVGRTNTLPRLNGVYDRNLGNSLLKELEQSGWFHTAGRWSDARCR